MKPTDLPLNILFIFFLGLFLLLGLLPAIRRRSLQLRQFLHRKSGASKARDSTLNTGRAALQLAQNQKRGELNDFEKLSLWQLSQAGKKGLSTAQLENQLHLEPALAKGVLRSLQDKEFVGHYRDWLLISRYRLSRRGYDYACSKGMIADIRASGNRLSPP